MKKIAETIKVIFKKCSDHILQLLDFLLYTDITEKNLPFCKCKVLCELTTKMQIMTMTFNKGIWVINILHCSSFIEITAHQSGTKLKILRQIFF